MRAYLPAHFTVSPHRALRGVAGLLGSLHPAPVLLTFCARLSRLSIDMDRLVGTVALVGFVLALSAHISALMGYDVGVVFPEVMFLHVGIFVVYIPFVVHLGNLLQRQGLVAPRRWWERRHRISLTLLRGVVPDWAMVVGDVLFLYAIANFFLSMVLTTEAAAVRLFSGHWMLFYYIPSTYFLFRDRSLDPLQDPLNDLLQDPLKDRDAAARRGGPSYTLYHVVGSVALEMLFDLRERGRGVPVMLGTPEDYERLAELVKLNDRYSTTELIRRSFALDPAFWFRARIEENRKRYAYRTNVWPGNALPYIQLGAHYNLDTGEPFEEVVIAVFPVARSWMIPAHLRIGHWNSIHPTEVHTALFRYWGTKYGATVACITPESIEFTVEHPPRTRTEALALAQEHYVYCAEIVDHDAESIEVLAARLLNATVWYFWWD